MNLQLNVNELYANISRRLYDRRLSRVAAKTGLSEMTIATVRDGTAKNPTLDTLQRLWDYLEENR